MSHGLAAMLDERKILNNVFSGNTQSIHMKLQNYHLVVMGNTCFKFQPDWTHGSGSQNYLSFLIWVLFYSFFFVKVSLGCSWMGLREEE